MEVKIKVAEGMHGAVILTVADTRGNVLFHDTFKGATVDAVESKGATLAAQWGKVAA